MLSNKGKTSFPIRLRNVGSSCYLNSAFQGLSACKTFVNEINNLYSKYDTINKLQNFKDLINDLNSCCKIELEISKYPIFVEWRNRGQQDSYEILIYTLNEAYNDLRKYKEDWNDWDMWLHQYLPMRFVFQYEIECECNMKTTSPLQSNYAFHVSIPINQKKNELSKLIDQYFAEDIIDDYVCSNTNCFNNKARKVAKLIEPFPHTLCIHLERKFWNNNKMTKINNVVTFNKILVIKSHFFSDKTELNAGELFYASQNKTEMKSFLNVHNDDLPMFTKTISENWIVYSLKLNNLKINDETKNEIAEEDVNKISVYISEYSVKEELKDKSSRSGKIQIKDSNLNFKENNEKMYDDKGVKRYYSFTERTASIILKDIIKNNSRSCTFLDKIKNNQTENNINIRISEYSTKDELKDNLLGKYGGNQRYFCSESISSDTTRYAEKSVENKNVDNPSPDISFYNSLFKSLFLKNCKENKINNSENEIANFQFDSHYLNVKEVRNRFRNSKSLDNIDKDEVTLKSVSNLRRYSSLERFDNDRPKSLVSFNEENCFNILQFHNQCQDNDDVDIKFEQTPENYFQAESENNGIHKETVTPSMSTSDLIKNEEDPYKMEDTTYVRKQLKDKTYELCSVIEHSSTFFGGHYVCYKRIGNKWFLTNDTEIREVSEEKVLDCKPYILFYEQECTRL